MATLVHTYVIQPFIIPTSSLEKSLLVGDFLFVSKYHYGARLPKTAIAAPMLHDTLPILKTKSYVAKPQIPTMRLPGFTEIKRNDIVVFNWPTDTLYNMYKTADKRYDKPIDKKTNYVKRCVAIPGDVLEIRDGIVFIDGKESILPDRARPQYSYKIAIDKKTPPNFQYILEEMNITDAVYQIADDTIVFAALPFENANRLKNVPGIKSVARIISKNAEDGIFPDKEDGKVSTFNNWSKDNYGPLTIPKKGATVTLNAATIPLYKAIIGEYENHDLKINGDVITIDGKVATNYTFEQDYFWMMGDNRHNSLDARYWGFTPEDHIVGKPIFIWMSIDGINGPKSGWKIRWDRVFTIVDGTGQPKSYFVIFLIGLALYLVGDYFWKKRKNNKLEA